MPQISRETTEQILAATDIVDVIGSYIEVKRAGPAFKALCPFHNEKTPSFNINPVRQFFHCFGCGKSGDAITFVREYENLTFSDAVKKLASRVGIAVVEEVTDPKEDRARRQRGRLLDLHREVTDFMHKMLFTREATHAREYLKSRGFGKEMAEGWKVGWMPERAEAFLQWARGRDFKRGEWLASGFFRENDNGSIYVFFRDRLMFPIRNEMGDVIAFSGRLIRENPQFKTGKYQNSPETAIFKKSNVLFALDRARKEILKDQAVVVCEGQVDTIRCHESGIKNVVGTQGTALTSNHAKLLRRYAKSAVLCFDSDEPGLDAIEKGFPILAAEGIPVKVARMPKGDDPDSFIRQNGPDAFREILSKSVDFFDFKIERAASQGRLDDLQQRSALARECSALLAMIPDPITRETMINHVATRLRAGIPEMRDGVARAVRVAKNKPAARDRNAPEEPERIGPAALEPLVAYLCNLALHSSLAQERIGEQFESLHHVADYVEGVPILASILSSRPDASSHAAVNAFIATMPEDHRLALQADPTFHGDIPGDPATAAEEAMVELSAKALYRWDQRVKAELARPDLSMEEMGVWLKQAKEVGDLQKGTLQRSIFNDRLVTVKKASKPPFQRGNRSFSKPENNP